MCYVMCGQVCTCAGITQLTIASEPCASRLVGNLTSFTLKSVTVSIAAKYIQCILMIYYWLSVAYSVVCICISPYCYYTTNTNNIIIPMIRYTLYITHNIPYINRTVYITYTLHTYITITIQYSIHVHCIPYIIYTLYMKGLHYMH